MIEGVLEMDTHRMGREIEREGDREKEIEREGDRERRR